MEQISNELNLFHLPNVDDQTNDDITLISVIDASGSMMDVWSELVIQYNTLAHNYSKNLFTITFDTHVYTDKKYLVDNIHQHGGGGTNITAPFEYVNSILRTKVKTQTAIILFISDGEDNFLDSSLQKRLKDLKNRFSIQKTSANFILKFYCLGIGQEFPTFVAMKLREIYDLSDTTTPPVFLVDTERSNDIQQQFQYLQPYFHPVGTINILTSHVHKYPWETSNVRQAISDSWVVSKKQSQITIRYKEKEIKLTKCQLDLSALNNCGKEWLQFLQLKSLNGSIKNESQKALQILNSLKSLIDQNNQYLEKNKSFLDRIKKLTIHENEVQDFNTVVREIRKLQNSQPLQSLSQHEAAQRLAIGTYIGKYHDQAVKMKGITVFQFLQEKEQLINILKNSQIDYQVSSQEPSIISLQNQKDILSEPGFMDALIQCPSQYELVQTLPIVGQALQVRRVEGSLINPWLIEIVNIARHNKSIDTVSIQQNNNQIEMQTGDGDKEIINCVLPLYEEAQDKDLEPVLNSKIFHILMTFNVMLNADTCFETAYCALLANTLLKLIPEPASEWKNDLLIKIVQTMRITYFKRKEFKYYSNQLIQYPDMAVVTEHPSLTTKCQDVSKSILSLFCIKEQYGSKALGPQQIKNIIHFILYECVGRMYPPQNKVSEYFSIQNQEELQKLEFKEYFNELYEYYSKQGSLVKKFYTLSQLKADVQKQSKKYNLTQDLKFKVTLDITKLNFLYKKYNLESLDKISKFFTGEGISKKVFVCYLYHASLYPNSIDRFNNKINMDFNQVYRAIRIQKTQQILKTCNLAEKVFQKLRLYYEDEFYQLHNCVIPLSQETLIEFGKKNGINNIQTKYSVLTHLLKLACMSTDCPYYMVPDKRLSSHLLAYPTIPGFHKTIRLNLDESPENLLVMMEQQTCLDEPKPQLSENVKKHIIAHRETLLKHIEQVSTSYKKIL